MTFSELFKAAVQAAGQKLQSALGFQSTYFIRGLASIIKGCVVAVLVVLCFNVIGYVLVTHQLSILDSSLHPAESYLGRVLLLAFIGFVDSAIAAFTVCMAGAAIYFACQGIQFIGGQPASKKDSRE